MTDDEVREWVRSRLAFEAWLRARHAARDAQSPAADELRIAVEPPPARGAGRFGTLRSRSDRGEGQSRRPTAA